MKTAAFKLLSGFVTLSLILSLLPRPLAAQAVPKVPIPDESPSGRDPNPLAHVRAVSGDDPQAQAFNAALYELSTFLPVPMHSSLDSASKLPELGQSASTDNTIFLPFVAAGGYNQAVVSPAGAELVFAGGSVQVNFPPGAVGEPTIVAFEMMPSVPRTTSSSSISHFSLQAEAVDSGTPVNQFDMLVTISVHYPANQVSSAASLAFYYRDVRTKAWLPLPTRVDPEQNTAQATTSHFTEFALMASPAATYVPIMEQSSSAQFSFNGVPFEYQGVDRWVTREPGNPYPSSEIINLSTYTGTAVHMITYGSWGLDLPTGTTLGYAIVHYGDGDSDTIPLVLGQNTAEWAYDRPEAQYCLAHNKIPQWEAYSWYTNQNSNSWYWAHNFYTAAPIQPKPLDSLELAINPDAYLYEINTGSPCYTPGEYNVGINGLTLQTSGAISVDQIPPTISNVWWRQDGAGSTIVTAVITDNVAVVAASLWWNGQEFPMGSMGGDRYYAIVPDELNGVVGQFRITAVDPSGNVGYWPDDGGTMAERIRYTIWAGLKTNTLMVGEPVNSATGSFFTQHQDIFVPGPGLDFEFKRFYNSVAAALDGPLGFGWTHSYNIHLEVVDDPLLQGVVVTYQDGHTANFEEDGSGGYLSPSGDHNTLAHEGSGFVLTRPDQVKYHFDGNGRLTSTEDSNHNTLQFSYTGDDLTQITDAAGRPFYLDYIDHRITRITDVLNRTWEYTYDGDGDLRTYKDPEEGLLQYTYTDEGWLHAITDPNGHVFVTNTYDERGRVTAQRDASEVSSFIEYLSEQQVKFTDNEGYPTTHTYDDQLRIVEDRDAKDTSVTYQYDADDNVTQITDRGGHPTFYTYDDRGNVLTRRDALSQTAEFQYDARNNLTYAKDEADAETFYEYDARDNLTHIHDAEDDDTWMTYDSRGLLETLRDANNHTTWFTYDAQGNLETVEDALHNLTYFEHDGVGRQTVMTDTNSHTVRFTYDDNDRVTVIADPKNQTTLFTYDPVGNLTDVTDRRGYTTTYAYNENDSLVTITDTRGYTATFTYDLMYHRKTFTDRRGHTTHYGYDPVYNLTGVIDAKNNATTLDYDADRNLITLTDALTQTTTFAYDPLHRVITATDALSGVTGYAYDPVGRPVQVQAPNGAVTSYAYDRLGRLHTLTDTLSNVTTFGYDAVGNLTVITNARGFAAHYGYDDVNQLVTVTNPLSHTLLLGYDGVGNVISMTNPRGYATFFAYDPNDNLEQVTDALGGLLTYTYDEEDNRLSVTNPNGHTTAFAYDPLGNLISVTLPLGQFTNFTYDPKGNLVAVTNAKGKTTYFTYDELDLLTTRTDPLAYVTTYEHDALRRLTRIIDAEENATDYRYDPLDRLITVTNALTGTTTYEYDSVGNLIAYTDANAHRTAFDVDLLGRVLTETNPITNTWGYAYDPVGNLIRRTDAEGVVTLYTFDAADRLTDVVYPSSPGVELAYDENDNLIGLTDASGAAAYAYDELDRLVEAQRTAGILAGETLGYGYDPASNRTRITYPDGKVVRYGYNANEWLTSVIDPMTGMTNYTYDPVGLPTHVQYPNGTWIDYGYDDADRLVYLFNGKPETSTELVSSYDYTLDGVGNRVRTVQKSTRGQVITWDKRYTYDPLYRLLEAVETPDFHPAQVLTSTFSYDAVGNRLLMSTNIHDQPNTPPQPEMVTTTYTYNAANQMLTAGTTGFAYDADGNRISMVGDERVISYTYDLENRLVGAETFDVLPNDKWKYDSTLDFTYDGLGRRVQRGVVDKGRRKTADFLYDALGYDLLAQYVDPGSPRTTYYYRDPVQILSRHEIQGAGKGLQYFYHYDGLGNVSAWTNHAGRAVQEYNYAPYGRLIDNNGPDNSSNRTDPHNSLTWSGKPWDKETELYHFGARDYDPTTGTWLTQDLYRGRIIEPMTLQRYQYARNNPVNWVDPYGFDGNGPGQTIPRSSRSFATSTKVNLVVNGTQSDPLADSKNGGTKYTGCGHTMICQFPAMFDFESQMEAGASASLRIRDSVECVLFSCETWRKFGDWSEQHDRAIRFVASIVGWVPIAGGVWKDNILYATGKIESKNEFLTRQAVNVAIAPLEAAGNKVFGVVIPKIGLGVKTIAKVGLGLSRELALYAQGATQTAGELWGNIGSELVKAPISYGVGRLGEELFPRGPGRPPVIGGNWSGPVGKSILGQQITDMAGNAVGDVTPEVFKGLINNAMSEDIPQESAQLVR